MSLATRCPACSTVFRVVRDQLKVSEGWVRCGRCSEVFDAAQRLFELEQDGAAPAAALTAPAAAADRASKPEAAAVSAGSHKSADTPVEPAVALAVEPAAAPSAQDASADSATPEPTPGFILQADRAARRRQPARRSSLAALSLLLAAMLVAQIALHYRDSLAAGWPLSRPWLQAACDVLGCRVEAPRRIDNLSVDSSGLVRVEGSALYRLSLVVQNKAPTAVRMPAFDLALTDMQGQTLARRVLRAAELGNPADSLPARGEMVLQATLDLGEHRVAGYTVELFYP